MVYVDTDEWLAELMLSVTAARKTRLRAVIDADLVVLDDLFLSKRLPEGGAELLQSLIHQRYKLRRSLIVTSNRVIADWGTYLGDNTTATTLLDRLMHRSHLLEFQGKSYRLKEAAEKLARKPKSR